MEGSLRLRTVGASKSLEHEIARGRSACIGSDQDVEIRIDDPVVAGRHALLSDRDGRWIIADLDSRTGTRLNGVLLSPDRPQVVGDGDLVEIGHVAFRVSLSGTPTATVGAEEEPEAVFETVHDAEMERAARERLTRISDYVFEVNAVSSETDLAELTVRYALAGTGFPRAAVLRGTGEEVEVVAARARDPSEAGAFGVSRKLIREASKGRLVRLSHHPDILTSSTIADLGIQKALCAPIRLGPTVAALLYLDSREGEHGVRPDAADFCATLSVVCGLALSNLKRADIEHRNSVLESELKAAREAQQLIVPEPSGVQGGLSYAMLTRPGMVVAGDMFDVVTLEDGRVAVSIGDVTGFGVGAGILMVAGQASLHAALKRTSDPATALTAVNDYISSRSAMNRFISMWVGVFDREQRTLTYADAGHGHWLLIGADGRATEPGVPCGIPVGIDSDADYCARTMPFPVGERIVLFSDGVVEQRSPNGQSFGAERVIAELAASRSSREDVDRLFATLVSFAGTEALADDTTVASVEWNG